MRLFPLVICLVTMAGVGSGCAGNMGPTGEAKSTGAALEGYVLFSPLLSTTTYLVDRQGGVVHTWESDFGPGASVYLLDSGNLLRCGRQPKAPVFHGGGLGGRIQEFRWDGTLAWDFVLASDDQLQHHDIEPLPNGNVLLIVYESKTREQALRAGRLPSQVGPAGLWPDAILEVRPIPPDGGEIVWEWHLWDHLIQGFAPELENYGTVSEHPELIDINGDRGPEVLTDEHLARLRSLGYVGGHTSPADLDADFVHTNSVAYNAPLDQIVLSIFGFNEIWVIDHGTTTEEAAGHSGGRSGRGGDLLYRWGNPRAYGRGAAADQQLFAQHDARWIPEGYPGAGNLLVFNNGLGRPDELWSSAIEIEPPLTNGGRYVIPDEGPFAPAVPVWEYTAADKESFYADFISAAQRLSDGNTFITAGPEGHFFEVTAGGEIVWEYVNPFTGDAPNPVGDPPYSVFRATFIPADHPGLRGRDLQRERRQP